MPTDPATSLPDELAAMKKISAALGGLDTEARRRVLTWAAARFRPAWATGVPLDEDEGES